MLENVEQRNALLTTIERARNSSVIAYFLHDNAVIADDALPHVYDKLHAIGRRERIDLLLYARGGMVEVSWRLLNLLREYCGHLGVIVGTRAQGAASLLALGADEILMGPLSELGSVEAARKHPLLPRDDMGQALPLSLGEIRSLMRFLGVGGKGYEVSKKETEGRIGPRGATKTQGTASGNQASGDLQPAAPSHASLAPELFKYIHPLVIAQLQQADTIAREVTRRALRLHLHPEDEAKIDQIVDAFNGGFHSHFYTVSSKELADLGLPVTEPPRELWNAIWSLAQLYQAAIYSERPDHTVPGAFFRYVCIIEAVGRTTGLHQSFTQSEGQERVVQVRWETAMKSPGPGPSFGPGGLSNN